MRTFLDHSLVFCVLLFIPELESFVGKVFPKSFTSYTSINKKFRLRDTVVTPTEESIQPTYYEKDLYSILGVQREATKSEIKEAYMKIVFNNHPDRNNTEEALCLFRNATYAYQVVGKDEKLRAAYDRKFDAQLAINVLEEVGNDIIRPLAMEVAVPLLNFTFQSIGSFAVPFIRDVLEHSTAVVKATIDHTHPNDKIEDYFNRAVTAIEKTTYNQNFRKLTDQLKKCEDSLNMTVTELNESTKTEKDAIESIKKLKAQIEVDRQYKQKLREDEVSAKEEFLNAELFEKNMTEKYIDISNDINYYQLELQNSLHEMNVYEEEVKRLEIELLRAQSKVRTSKDTYSKVLQKLIDCQAETENSRDEYQKAIQLCTVKTSEFETLLAEHRLVSGRLNKYESDIIKYNASIKNERENRLLLLKKIDSIQYKKQSLKAEISQYETIKDKKEAQEIQRTGNIFGTLRGTTSMDQLQLNFNGTLTQGGKGFKKY